MKKMFVVPSSLQQSTRKMEVKNILLIRVQNSYKISCVIRMKKRIVYY